MGPNLRELENRMKTMEEEIRSKQELISASVLGYIELKNELKKINRTSSPPLCRYEGLPLSPSDVSTLQNETERLQEEYKNICNQFITHDMKQWKTQTYGDGKPHHDYYEISSVNLQSKYPLGYFMPKDRRGFRWWPLLNEGDFYRVLFATFTPA